MAAAGVAALLLLASIPGADTDRYAAWARAFESGDILALGGETASPMGLPLSQWSHGPGLLGAMARRAAPRLLDARDGIFLVGWTAAVCMWLVAVPLLRRAARGDRALAVLGLFVLAVATHAGYYSRSHGSESLVYGLTALLMWYALGARRLGSGDLVAIGCTVALLAVTRAQYLMYALPALARAAVTLSRWPWRARWGRGAAALALPLLPAVVQVAMVNRWMTGHLAGSPYNFGDGSFRSVDWFDPEILAVLVHPWHGLLVYHPVYLLGFGALVAELAAARRRRRWVLGATLLAIAANLYLQAAWYVWWLGIATFGMRGLAPAALPLTMALVSVLARADRRLRAVLLIAIAACLVWSSLLLRLGVSELLTFDEVWRAQASGPDAMIGPQILLAFAIGLGATAWWLRTSSPSDLRHSLTLGVTALGGALTTVSLLVLWRSATLSSDPTALLKGAANWLLLLAPIVALGAALRSRFALGTMAAGAPLVLAAILAVTSLLFGRMAIDTERRIAAGTASYPARYTAEFDVLEVRASYEEYARVAGFEDKKAALRTFLMSRGMLEDR